MKYPILLAILCLYLVSSSQDIPVQAQGYGFSVGDPYGTLHIQFFLDFQCPDSKASFNVWSNVRKSISLQQNRVKLTYQFNPLPYHFYAIYLHQAFFYVLKKAGQTAADDFISYVFNKQDDFIEENYLDKTATQVADEFSRKLAPLFGLNADELKKEMVIGSESFKSMKNHWRYTTIEHGVAGAPLFYANGVRVDAGEDFGYNEWINFIKEYKS